MVNDIQPYQLYPQPFLSQNLSQQASPAYSEPEDTDRHSVRSAFSRLKYNEANQPPLSESEARREKHNCKKHCRNPVSISAIEKEVDAVSEIFSVKDSRKENRGGCLTENQVSFTVIYAKIQFISIKVSEIE